MVHRVDLGHEIVEKASKLALDMRPNLSTRKKPDGSLVTNADFAVEALMRQLVAEKFPRDGFLGEEYDKKEPEIGFTWEADPIDFTWGYANGRDNWTINLSLMYGEDIGYAWVARPDSNEIIHGSLINELHGLNPVQIKGINGATPSREEHRKVPRLLHARMVRVSSETYHPDSLVLESIAKSGKVSIENGSCGSFSNVLAQMAVGRIDTFIARSRNGYESYDVNAGIHLLESAGGLATDPYGSPVDGRYIVAARSPELHEELLEVVREYNFGRP